MIEKADEVLRNRIETAREGEELHVLFRLMLDMSEGSREAIRVQVVPVWERLRGMGLSVRKAVSHPWVVVVGTPDQVLRALEDEAVFTASLDSPVQRRGV